MTNGRAHIAVNPAAHVVIDPSNTVLRQLDVIDNWNARKEADATNAFKAIIYGVD